jgi:hypothetical protein
VGEWQQAGPAVRRRGRRAGIGLLGVVALLATGLAADRLRPMEQGSGETWAVTVGSAMSGDVPVDPEERCYEDPDGDLADMADVDACLQRLVDDGVIGADVLAELRCLVTYESLPPDVPDDEYARAGEAFRRCMVAVAAPSG